MFLPSTFQQELTWWLTGTLMVAHVVFSLLHCPMGVILTLNVLAEFAETCLKICRLANLCKAIAFERHGTIESCSCQQGPSRPSPANAQSTPERTSAQESDCVLGSLVIQGGQGNIEQSSKKHRDAFTSHSQRCVVASGFSL